MMFLSKILLLVLGATVCFHLIVCQNISESQDLFAEYKLIFAHAIVRHGDRNIKRTYPNDPYKNKTYWKNGFGELSDIGKREQYSLGKWFRKRYQELIGETFSNDKIYIRSSDETRNLMSAQSHAAGLFPPEKEAEQWNDQLGKKWQPVPVHSVPDEDDFLLNSRAYCPRFKKLLEGCDSSPKIQGIMEKYRDFIDFIQENSGKTIRNVHDVSKMYDILFVENRRNYTLPDWAKRALSNNSLNYLGAVGYQSLTCTTELKKMKAGFLIKEMLDRFKKKAAKKLKPNRTLGFYFTQATVLVSVLNALDMFDDEIPPFASAIMLELYKRRGKFYVQILYKKDPFSTEDEKPLKIPKCGVKCELDEFYRLYADILPTEDETYESICAINDGGDNGGGYNIFIILGSVFIGVAFVTLLIFVLVRNCRGKGEQNSQDFNRA